MPPLIPAFSGRKGKEFILQMKLRVKKKTK